VESIAELLPTLNRILGFLQGMEGDKGVPKQDKLAETNIINSSIGNRESQKTTFSSQEKSRITEFAKIFGNILADIQRAKMPDAKPQTFVGSIARNQNKTAGAINGTSQNQTPSLSGLGVSLMLIVGGIAAFVTGLMNDGPFRGALKILSRLGIEGGLKLLKSVVMTAFHSLVELPEKLFGTLGGKFMELIGEFGGGLGGRVLAKLEKNFLGKMAIKLLKPLSKVLTKLPIIGMLISLGFAYVRFKDGDIVGGIIDTINALVGLLVFTPAAPFVVPIQIGLDVLNAWLDYKSDQGEGKPKLSKLDILGDMVKSIGGWLWDNAKDVPLLGTFKYLGMAWDSFKGGKLTESLTNLAYGLVAIIPGGGLIIRGIEALMSYLNPNQQPEEPNLNVAAAASSTSSWVKSIGDWIWNNGENIPVISTFKYLSKAWDAFNSGDMMKGLEYIIRSVPGVDMLIQGYNMLSSLFNTSESTDSSIGNTNINWIDKVKDFVRSKMKDLPMVLRKPLEWLGIISDDVQSTAQNNTMMTGLQDSVNSGFEKSKEFFRNVWDGIGTAVSTKVDQIKSFASEALDKVKPYIEKAKSFASETLDKATIYIEKAKSFASEALDKAAPYIEKAKSFASGTLDNLTSFIGKSKEFIKNTLAGSEKQLNNTQEIQNENDKIGQRVANISSVQTERLGLMISLSQKHLAALNNLIIIGNMSLTELKRMNSNSTPTSVPTIPNSSSAPTKDLIEFVDNRDGYFSSVYRLGS